jgi:DNA-binding Xre family transcriptional regulator
MSICGRIDRGSMIINLVAQKLAAKGATRYSAARDSGIASNTLYRLCNKPETVPSGAVLNLLCAYFECQPGDLLGRIRETKEQS